MSSQQPSDIASDTDLVGTPPVLQPAYAVARELWPAAVSQQVHTQAQSQLGPHAWL